ncbi:hypothetical protein HDV63DRAFT_295412 [Trichoderma sp. SZMC 28014]
MHHGGHSLHESCACTIVAAKQGSEKRFRVSRNDVCCARDAARHRADCYSPIGPLPLRLLKSRLDGHKITGRRRTNHAALCALVRCLCRSAIHTRFVTSDWRAWLAAQMRRRDILRRWRHRPVSRDSRRTMTRGESIANLTSGNCFNFFSCHRSFDDTKTTWTKPSDPASYIGSLFQHEPVPYCGQYLMHNELAPTRPTHVQHIIKNLLCAKAVDA